MSSNTLLTLSTIIGGGTLLLAYYFYTWVSKQPAGTERMREIASAIHEGAVAFLKREYLTLVYFIIVMTAVIAIFINPYSAIAYVMGSISSIFAGWFGMQAATRANVRTTEAAKKGQSQALRVAFTGGSVMGLAVAGLGVFGLSIAYLIFKDPNVINAFGMGASSVALFARVGGGIYTKSADVGSDLVGKVEKNIPEDDPRNAGVIADNVGDNVGDVAGMGADLFESYVGAVIAAMVIGLTAFSKELSLNAILYPLILIAVGTVASIIGSFYVQLFGKGDPQSALRWGTYVSAIILVIVAIPLTKSLLNTYNPLFALLAGLIVGIIIGLVSEYYTSGKPIVSLAESAQTGAGTVIIRGLALGMKSIIVPVIMIAGAIGISWALNGLYGVAIAGVGMLATIGIVMSTDAYGPIADNAGGIAEMAGLGANIRKITDRLDALGNTTAAIGKGFAIGSAALTALALFSAYTHTVGLSIVNILSVKSLIGAFIGALMPFMFSAFAMEAVGRTANLIVEEVRRQFREIKGLMEGKARAEYARCVDIATKGALREMLAPSITAVVAPIIIGLVLGKEAVGGFLLGAILTGVALAIMMANSGGAWDNAKKYIEAGNLGGKGTPTHAAAVIGDTVGDPFKDTAGPSMNILIKLMSIIALVFGIIFR
ncbi:sodium-translocating pyrophosphatase [bacterium]|nr:sodium-translocating pyrophosphatase [bacterium]